MNKLLRNAWLLLLLPAGMPLAGCGQPQAPAAPPRTPEVEVGLPTTRDVTDFEEFTGWIDGVKTVELHSQVTGILKKIHFKDGDDVREGQLLFEIDPSIYKAQLDKAEADAGAAEARARRLSQDYQRAGALVERGAIGREEFEKVSSDWKEADKAVLSSRATRKLAEVNLEFTRITAPIGGRISRRYVDEGNLIKANDTALTLLVSVHPVYAYFDVDERTVLKLRRLLGEGMIKAARNGSMAVHLGLADEKGYPHDGTINFEDNRLDAGTGTLRLRGEFANLDQILYPGLYVKIKLPIGKAYSAILIPEHALGTDQGQKFVYVVGADNKVEYRPVQVGRLQSDGLRVITEGLKREERVVVNGLQRVRQGIEVVPLPPKEPAGTAQPQNKDNPKQVNTPAARGG